MISRISSNQPRRHCTRRTALIGKCDRHRSAFTLIELMLVISAIAVLTALGVRVLAEVEQDALHRRTQAQIARIEQVLHTKLEESWYRILPFRLDDSIDPDEAYLIQTAALEEILRVEFPTRRTDLLDNSLVTVADYPLPAPYTSPLPFYGYPTNLNVNPTSYDWTNFPTPQITFRYRSKLNMEFDGSDFDDGTKPQEWTAENDGAECLYAILSLHYLDDGTAAISILRERQIGDTDGDGRKEVLDAFGDPLEIDLVDSSLVDEFDQPIDPNVDPHIDPRFDPTIDDIPASIQNYRFIVTSPNTELTTN